MAAKRNTSACRHPVCKVGYIEGNRGVAISFDDRADSKEVETLLEELEREEFTEQEYDTTAQGADVFLTARIPLSKVNARNFTDQGHAHQKNSRY